MALAYFFIGRSRGAASLLRSVPMAGGTHTFGPARSAESVTYELDALMVAANRKFAYSFVTHRCRPMGICCLARYRCAQLPGVGRDGKIRGFQGFIGTVHSQHAEFNHSCVFDRNGENCACNEYVMLRFLKTTDGTSCHDFLSIFRFRAKSFEPTDTLIELITGQTVFQTFCSEIGI